MNKDRISEVYDGTWGSPEFQERSRARIHWLCRHAEGRRVLDVGCSQGIASILLGREGKTVWGVDREAVAVEAANERLADEEEPVQKRVSFLHSDVADLDAQDVPFDSALLGEVIEHQVNPGAVLETAAALVRPGGALVFSTPYGLLPYHDHKDPIYLETLVELLSDTLQLEEIELLDRYLCGVIRVLGPGETAPQEPPYRTMLALSEERLRRQDAEVVRAGGRQTQLRDELKAARDTVDELRARAAGHESAVAELERLTERHADAEARVQQMGEQLNEARLSARTHRMHRERLESERESLQRDVDARDAHLRELRKLAQDHEQDAAVARAELSVFERRLGGLEKEAERLSSELITVRQAEADARIAEQRARSAHADLERSLRDVEARAQEREAARAAIAGELDEVRTGLRAERDALAVRLEALDAELRNMTAQVAEATTRRDEADRVVAAARQERRSIQRKLDRREIRIRTLASQLEEQRAAAATASAVAKRLDAVAAEHESTVSRLREREQQLGRLIEERDALGAQLEDVRQAAATSADRESALRKRANDAKEDAVRLRVERDKLAGMLETQDQRLANAEQRARDLAAELDRQSAAAATATAQIEQLRTARLAQPAGP